MTDTLEPQPERKETRACPNCLVFAAVGSNPHCHSKNCIWSVCRCETTYDRFSTNSFTTKKVA